MLNMLLSLTKNMWFKPMSEFDSSFYNADEIKQAITLENCIEFGTNNGQELLIYALDESNSKYIKYSCCYTTLYDIPFITDIFSKEGKHYTLDRDRAEIEASAFNAVRCSKATQTAVEEAEKALDNAAKALDDPNNYGALLSYTNYMYAMGLYHAYIDMLDTLDADKFRTWFELAERHAERINQLEKRADTLYRGLKKSLQIS